MWAAPFGSSLGTKGPTAGRLSLAGSAFSLAVELIYPIAAVSFTEVRAMASRFPLSH